MQHLEDRIFKIQNHKDFSSLALEIFHYQARKNQVYSSYIENLKIRLSTITDPAQIPFLPIGFFKTHTVITGEARPLLVFHSSGTTGQLSSKHHLSSENIYKKSLLNTFSSRFGDPEDLCVLALLPSYLERGSSSLVYMMNYLIQKSRHPESGFYLNDLNQLNNTLNKRITDNYPTLLLGVSYALLNLAEQFPNKLTDNIILIETGGMKGRRKEMTREELHSVLINAFGVENIQSEYGMTELLSQAYTAQNGRFVAPPWMKVYSRDIYDPLTLIPQGQRGGINIIDLANLNSCSFISTEDLGIVYEDASFQILGRFDQSDIRGCNLMVE